MNSKKIVEGYLNKTNWRVKESSSTNFSIGSLNKHIVTATSKDYWLRHVYPEYISQAYRDNAIHIHDLGGLTLYCCGYSLQSIIAMGVQGIDNIPTSAPAKHFDSILNQLANLITVFQNEIMGAVAFSSVDTLLAPFIKEDNLSYRQVKQSIQNFIYSINSNSRGGAEPAFSNITLDIFPASDLADKYVSVGGEIKEYKYKKCQKEMDMFNKAFQEVMLKGDYAGEAFAYPIPTYNIYKGFDWDNPNSQGIWEMAGKYGYPYFANYLNSDMDPSDARSMCPLTSDTEVLVKSKQNGIRTAKISEIVNATEQKGTKYQVFSNGKWFDTKPVKTPMTKVYEIHLSNGTVVKMGENHLQPTKNNGVLSAKDLQKDMLLPFDKIYTFEKAVYDNSRPYDEDETYNYYRITDIKEVNTKNIGKYLYCFEVDNEDHLFMLANGLVTHNCRLRLDLRELKKRNGGLFGSGDSTGSIGVVTINLPRIAHLSKDKDEFFKLLEKYLDVAKDSLEIKRTWLQKEIFEKHAIPAFETYVGTIKNHFSTIGVVGMNEMCVNLLNVGIEDNKGRNFALEVSDFIREKLMDYQEETGNLYNYEATPAESTTYRFAKRDVTDYGDDTFYQGTKEAPYYTNSCHLPVNHKKTIKELLDHQDDLQTKFTGGTVIHLFLDKAITAEQAKTIIRESFTKYSSPYISISPISRTCEDHGYIEEAVDNCPICGKRLIKKQRVTGYIRKVDGFNDGKKSEFRDRTQYTL